MTEEEFVKIQESLKNGGSELKKIKKETLLEFAEMLEVKADIKENELSDKYESLKFDYERYGQTLKEYQELIAEMKTKDENLREEIKRLIKERIENNDKYKNKISLNYLIIALLVIALIILISL